MSGSTFVRTQQDLVLKQIHKSFPVSQYAWARLKQSLSHIFLLSLHGKTQHPKILNASPQTSITPHTGSINPPCIVHCALEFSGDLGSWPLYILYRILRNTLKTYTLCLGSHTQIFGAVFSVMVPVRFLPDPPDSPGSVFFLMLSSSQGNQAGDAAKLGAISAFVFNFPLFSINILQFLNSVIKKFKLVISLKSCTLYQYKM